MVVNQTILGEEFEMGVFQMEFDQDLYLSGQNFLCGEAEKACPTSDCLPCDWSSQEVSFVKIFSLFFFQLAPINFFFFLSQLFSIKFFISRSHHFLVHQKNSLQDVIMLNVVVQLKLEEMLGNKQMNGVRLQQHLTIL